ncbi:STAS domain-containing protein [Streptomyces sp. NPDC045714]|uniref:STAS domain-containing protein n=1 Tax=Streptomyces sp. NPDC045714 TaxID=3154913 RepID=UPI0033CC8A69
MQTPPLLYVDRRQEETRTVIVLAGAMDSDSARAFTAAMTEISRAGAAAVHVDPSAVAFCDCGGLTALLTAVQDSRTQGRTSQAHAPSPAVLRLFTLTGTVGILLGSVSRTPGPCESAARSSEDRSAAPPV